MFNFLKKILKPPVFDDDKDTHQAYLLNAILTPGSGIGLNACQKDY